MNVILLRNAACIVLLLLLGIAAASTSIESGRIRGENGELSLTICVPLSSNNEQRDGDAWQHMAAAVLAVDQFNTKDPAVVKELEQFRDCHIRFVNVTIVDTGTDSHQAMKSVLKSIQTTGPPDAIAGPYNELPALELSVLATGMESPMMAFRGIDQNLVLPDKHPFYSQINPDLHGEMEFLGEYLKHTGRDNFIAVIYSNEDSVLQRLEVLRAVLKENGVDQMKAFSFKASERSHDGEDRGIWEAVEKIAKTGFRTIVMMTSAPDVDTPELGKAVHHFELDQGGHFWVMPGGLDPSSTDKDNILEVYGRTDVGGFLTGMAYLTIFEKHQVKPDVDTFAPSMKRQNATFVRRLRELNPIPEFFAEEFCGLEFTHQPNTPFPPDDIFQRLLYISDRSTFAFDATMALGIGACLATANNTNGSTAMTGAMHQQGIQSADFIGASGRVKFQNSPRTPGSRQGNSIYFGIINLVPPGEEMLLLKPSEYLDPETQEWKEVSPFVYPDGSDSPPILLRSQPDQNYLEPGVRIFGLTLMSIALFVIFASVIWVFVNRHHRVVIAAQPPFLYVLCLGSTITCFVILLSSFDEGAGWSDAMLDKACLAMPWLASLGHIVTYSALFTKLWRVNKVLQFKRAQINISQVMWPALFLVVGATVILAVWTATSEFGWERKEIDDLSGESIGKCTSCHTVPFLVPVGILCVVPTVLTGILAWKTSDVDDLYSESKWIFSLILVQLQVIVVGVPVIVILQDVSPNGRFIGLSLLMSTFPLSTMGLIVAPKMLAVRREKLGATKGATRGSLQGTRVSGASIDPSANSGLTSNTARDPNQSSLNSQAGIKAPRVQMVTMH